MQLQDLQEHDVLILMHQQKMLLAVDQQNYIHSLGELDQSIAEYLPAGSLTPVGAYRSGICYVAEVSIDVDLDKLVGFRELLGQVDLEIEMLVSRAMQLVTWSNQHQYCGQCGKPTVWDAQDLAKYCKPCDLRFYPRISPCIMVLVTRGDRCLLAHHSRHKEDMFSTLAGFVEAGETLEHAVAREVKEEVGVEIGGLKYFNSQPWPFPHQLMIGFFAEYQSGDIVEDGIEVVDARWFRYDELPMIPPPESLSGQLIGRFVDACKVK